MENCIFCKVVSDKLPSYKVYEDDKFIAILDIFPKAKGHTLIVPKKHYQWVYDVPEFSDFWQAALKVTNGIQKGLKTTFVHYITFGFHVPHAHIHIIPHFKPIEQEHPLGRDHKFTKEEFQEIAEKIKNAV